MGDTGEKTEEASPEKLRKAQEEGQVPKSQDFVSALGFAAGFMTLAALFEFTAVKLKEYTLASLDAAARDPSMATVSTVLGEGMFLIVLLSIPTLGIVFVMGIMSNVLQTGFFFAWKAIQPKFDKINPVNGMKNLFKMKKVIELIKNIVKIVIIGWLGWSIISDDLQNMVMSLTLPLTEATGYAGAVLWDFMVKVIIAFVVIGVADLILARKEFAKEMMMSKYDVKQEYKQQEGDPHMKGERRRLAHELLFSGGSQAVKNADAVVVNPDHIAVAIKYDQEKGKAPRVVAKGMRIHAEKIKELAKQYGVPILRNVPLAQALYKLDIDEEVPEELYEAVAEILAFVFKLREEQEAKHKRPRGPQTITLGQPPAEPVSGKSPNVPRPSPGRGVKRLKGE